MEHQKNFDKDQKRDEFVEKLVTLNRTCKTVKGGRRMSFSALTVVGDKKGRVGYGVGKANDVSEAIKKSIDRAKKSLEIILMDFLMTLSKCMGTAILEMTRPS